MQFDTSDPFNAWGIVLAGQCSTEEFCTRRRRSGGAMLAPHSKMGAPEAASARRELKETSRRDDSCTVVYWCEWGPKGRFSRSMAVDFHPDRPRQLYIGVATAYCEHCMEWEGDPGLLGSWAGAKSARSASRARCKQGKQQEDYYGTCAPILVRGRTLTTPFRPCDCFWRVTWMGRQTTTRTACRRSGTRAP
eukprot:2662786-Rhodomonas_salina.1